MVVVTENFLRTKYPAMVTYVAKPKTEFVLERKAADKIRTFYSASQVANIWM